MDRLFFRAESLFRAHFNETTLPFVENSRRMKGKIDFHEQTQSKKQSCYRRISR